MKKEGKPVAANVEKLLSAGQKSWYADDPKTPSAASIGSGNWQLAAGSLPEGVWSVEVAKNPTRGQEKLGSLARRPRRWRRLHRVSLQDERPRRRHHRADPPDAKARGPATTSTPSSSQRRPEFFRRRQLDAPAHVRPGRRVDDVDLASASSKA